MRGGYLDLVFGVQALRRRTERDVLLGGAAGVAARLLPHQLANVERVLLDLEVRHLLADEVGLGKTTQALMVLNALRLRRPDLKAGIVVPDALMAQWRDELRARAHVAPIESATASWDTHRPLLLWPQLLHAAPLPLAELDLLIVDEIQQLTQALQSQIVAAARDMEHLLVLTATPPLNRSADLRRLLQLIEPARVDHVDGDAFEALRARELLAAEALRTGEWCPDLGGRPPGDARPAAAAAHAASRRLLRTRRADWRGLLPSRRARLRVVEPTSAERERQRLMWRYFRYLGDLAREVDLDLLAQRALRGPASLRQRVTELKGQGHDRRDLLAEVQRLLRPDLGDSRLDALLDTLCEIWASEPSAPVLIAAGDNLTVDDLAKRLPRMFDEGPDSPPLTIATLRNQTRGADGLADPADAIASAVSAFNQGQARVLIAAEAGSVGLNLQCTRHLVLYSVPWDPKDVEQWIGRVDRIGNAAARTSEGDALPIDVHLIAQRGLVDERVAQVIHRTGALDRSVSLDREAVRLVREAVQRAALSDEPDAWQSALTVAEQVGISVELADLDLPLLADAPWTPRVAAARGATLIDTPPAGPTLGSAGSGESGRQRALEAWLTAMERAGMYDLRRADDARTIGYPQRATRARAVADAAPAPLDEDVIPWPERPYAFYLSRRGDLSQPPVTHKRDHRGELAALHFLDHGSPLHEALLHTWIPRDDWDGEVWEVKLPPDDALAPLKGALVYVRVAVADPAASLSSAEYPSHLLQADERFLRAALPPRVLVTAAAVTPSATRRVAWSALGALIAPDPRSHLLEGTGRRLQRRFPVDAAARARAETAREAAELSRAAWSPLLDAARSAVERRRYLVRANLADQRAGAERALASLRAHEAATGRSSPTRARDLQDDLEAQELVAASRDAALAAALDRAMSCAPALRAEAGLFLT